MAPRFVLVLAGCVGLSFAACYDDSYRDISLATEPQELALSPGEGETFGISFCRTNDSVEAFGDLAIALEPHEGQGTIFVSVQRPLEDLWYSEVNLEYLKLYAIQSHMSVYADRGSCGTQTRVSLRLSPQAPADVVLTWQARLDARTDADDGDLTLEVTP